MVCGARSTSLGLVPDHVEADTLRDSEAVTLLSRSAYLPVVLAEIPPVDRFQRRPFERFEASAVVALQCDGRSSIGIASSADYWLGL